MSNIVYAFLGGLLLGIATVGYLYINGRIAGISGLMAQLIRPTKDTFKSSAFWFIAGLVITPFIYSYFYQPDIEIKSQFICTYSGRVTCWFWNTARLWMYKWSWYLWYESALKTLNNSDSSFYVCWHVNRLYHSPCVGVIL